MALNRDSLRGHLFFSASGMLRSGHHLRLAAAAMQHLVSRFPGAGDAWPAPDRGAEHYASSARTSPVRAAIHSVDGLSAHADQKALLGLGRAFIQAPANLRGAWGIVGRANLR